MPSNAERETHISQTGDDHETWIVYTDDPYWIRRLDKVADCYGKSIAGDGRYYQLQASQVSLRAVRKPLSDDEKARRAQNLARARDGSKV